jgi:hypothetical protein
MSDYSMTILNTIDAFGSGESTKWGIFEWANDNWGSSLNKLALAFDKIISNDQYVTDSVDLSAGFNRTFQNTLSVSFETDDENIFQDDWEYVFPAPSVNAEDRQDNSWQEL